MQRAQHLAAAAAKLAAARNTWKVVMQKKNLGAAWRLASPGRGVGEAESRMCARKARTGAVRAGGGVDLLGGLELCHGTQRAARLVESSCRHVMCSNIKIPSDPAPIFRK